jgi:hypothetical protein
MYIGNNEISEVKEKDGMVSFVLKDEKHTITKQLFDLISFEDQNSNGDSIKDVIDFNVSIKSLDSLADLGLELIDAYRILQRQQNLISSYVGKALGKILGVEDELAIPLKDLLKVVETEDNNELLNFIKGKLKD